MPEETALDAALVGAGARRRLALRPRVALLWERLGHARLRPHPLSRGARSGGGPPGKPQRPLAAAARRR